MNDLLNSLLKQLKAETGHLLMDEFPSNSPLEWCVSFVMRVVRRLTWDELSYTLNTLWRNTSCAVSLVTLENVTQHRLF